MYLAIQIFEKAYGKFYGHIVKGFIVRFGAEGEVFNHHIIGAYYFGVAYFGKALIEQFAPRYGVRYVLARVECKWGRPCTLDGIDYVHIGGICLKGRDGAFKKARIIEY